VNRPKSDVFGKIPRGTHSNWEVRLVKVRVPPCVPCRATCDPEECDRVREVDEEDIWECEGGQSFYDTYDE